MKFTLKPTWYEALFICFTIIVIFSEYVMYSSQNTVVLGVSLIGALITYIISLIAGVRSYTKDNTIRFIAFFSGLLGVFFACFVLYVSVGVYFLPK